VDTTPAHRKKHCWNTKNGKKQKGGGGSGGGGGGKVSRNGLSLSFYSYAMFNRKKVSTLI
jgi:hypothetical protein